MQGPACGNLLSGFRGRKMAVKTADGAQCEISPDRKVWALERIKLGSCLSPDRIPRKVT